MYVVDTSCFPSIGAVNPALTAMANALRVGDHLLEQWASTSHNRSPQVSHNESPANGKHRVVIVAAASPASAAHSSWPTTITST